MTAKSVEAGGVDAGGMQPYYQRNGTAIYHADSRDILPALPQVDLVVTDPPYGIRFQSNHRVQKHKRIAGDDTLPLDLIWLAIAKARCAAYVFCRWGNLAAMPAPKSVLAWVKDNHSMGDLKHEHGRKWEACCFYAQAHHQFVKRIPDVLHAKRTGNKLHPTEKPVELIEQLIRANVCDTVLDPFMGSGTTLLAAMRCNKQAIGIELDEQYCEVAARRLETEYDSQEH